MQEYYYLFVIAGLWLVFATFQDLKTREVSNWLNFSLLGIVLGYRAFYSVFSGDSRFFFLGLLGFGLFYAIGTGFYYSRVFAGGDTKLFWAMGAILPYRGGSDIFILGIGFILLLLLVGAVYSLIYSGFLVSKNKKKFMKEFNSRWTRGKRVYFPVIIIALLLILFMREIFVYWIALFLFVLPILYFYLMALDKCMIKSVDVKNLTEGDWLEENVKVGGKTVKKSVHGLSAIEIALLRKSKKFVLIKFGIPFIPVFLISYLIMVYVFLILGLEWIVFSF